MALRTPEPEINCRGPKDPREARFGMFPVGGDVVNPWRLCSSHQRRILRQDQADIQLVSGALKAQPVGEPASATDEKPALASAGLTNQVESRRPSQPSSRW